ncbi:MAG TPA: hypothetical protein DEB39_01550 [Planctomycetaceae bacterium]|nr:hypothetical protein [Planctomycetaceae bacterium]
MLAKTFLFRGVPIDSNSDTILTTSATGSTIPILVSDRLRRWSESAPNWEAANGCRQVTSHFLNRCGGLERRLSMPLIVATLGGTGTGKSTLVNALLGAKIVKDGRERPTTDKPVIVCRPEIDLKARGIDTTGIRVEKHSLPSLEHLVLIDCPDPDTTESPDQRESNLDRLRNVLPLCDVLLITGTQQKYRSRRVADTLADAAPGARLLFVQTHADRDVDIRDDWREVLKERYEPGHIFLIDSVAALNSRLAAPPGSFDGGIPDGEFGDLHRLLTRDLNEESAIRIREANYADLAEEVVELCRSEIEEHWAPIDKLREKILEERRRLGERLAERMRDELIRDRRLWESRLIGRVASQWGYSPFSLVLRVYQGFGSLLSGALLARAATSIPLFAVWGLYQGGRSLKKWKDRRKSKAGPGGSIVRFWEEGNVRESALILAGFAQDARLPVGICTPERVLRESNLAGDAFVAEVARELERICDRLARRHNTWAIRLFYETLMGGMLLFLLFRPAKNFFWDTLRDSSIPIHGFDFYIISLCWLIAWGAVLLGAFTFTLRQGLDREINETAATWSRATGLDALFHELEEETNRLLAFRNELESIRLRLTQMDQIAEKLDKRLGKRKFMSTGSAMKTDIRSSPSAARTHL